jgi:protein-disulfide isomerase
MPPRQRPNRVATPGTGRRPSKPLLLGLVAGAVVVTAGAIALSLTLGGSHTATAPTTTVASGSLGLVDGIPQHGLVLGNPKAKVTLTEYIDTSCPICKDYVLTTFPAIVKQYVRPGKVKIEASPLAFVGPSSTRGRQLLLAAARQDKAWQFAELLYHNQGDETTAWLTDDSARTLATTIPGLNVDTQFADASGRAVSNGAAAADSQAQADGVTATPTFILTTSDGKRHFLGAGNPDFAAFAKVLDRALGTSKA